MSIHPSGAPAHSRQVQSNQVGIHRDLVATVIKHRDFEYRRPITGFSQAVFADLDRLVRAHASPLVLDSGCGVGESTYALAQAHPDHLVIGIDKSHVRIERARLLGRRDNLHFVRGDCIDIWRLARDARWRPMKHFLLYPNPWPKAKHLQRRWHGHPVFGALLGLGGQLDLRSNWKIYVDEFALALATLAGITTAVKTLSSDLACTPFERKYLASSHRVYRLTCDLPPNPRAGV